MIAIRSFATAHRLGILSVLQEYLRDCSPKIADLGANALVSLPPKAYRWIRETQEIADTLSEEGGFQIDMFAVALANVGKEKTEASHPKLDFK